MKNKKQVTDLDMALQQLRVTAHGQHVGDIFFDGKQDQYTFSYAADWLNREGRFALSPHIPLTTDSLDPGVVQRFLQNLLPEGSALDVVSVNHQISKHNTFGLIALLGNEPVGALTFRRPNVEQTEDSRSIRRGISNDELSERIRHRQFEPFPVWDGKVRLSVAGYQDKLQVLIEREQISLVDGTLSSTHILKPESRSTATPCMVANEHFCMTLAQRMGLPVASVEIWRIPDPILLIKRFDREVTLHSDGSGQVAMVTREHVIDGCQALDLPVSFKYERNLGNGRDVRHIRDGVSFEGLFKGLALEHPLSARLTLLRWALFQILIGNSDAHGKNLSFYVRGERLVPAPFYDLVSVNVYGGQVEQELAMAYGDAFLIDDIGAFDLADFAMRISMSPNFVANELIALASKARALAPTITHLPCYEGQEKAIVDRIARHVVTQSDRLLRIAPLVPQVDPDLL